jgi:hypothetical protein
MLYAFVSPINSTYLAHLNLLDFNNPRILDIKYKFEASHYVIFFITLLAQNIIFSNLLAISVPSWLGNILGSGVGLFSSTSAG